MKRREKPKKGIDLLTVSPDIHPGRFSEEGRDAGDPSLFSDQSMKDACCSCSLGVPFFQADVSILLFGISFSFWAVSRDGGKQRVFFLVTRWIGVF